MEKLLTLFCSLLLVFSTGRGQVRILQVDPQTDEIAIKNFGTAMEDISAYRLCSRFQYTQNLTSAVTTISGSPMLMGGDTLVVSWSIDDVSADVGLYLGTGSFGSSDAMVDFMQYGAEGIGRESVANTKAIWTIGDFIAGSGPFSYTGDGSENGVSFWEAAPEAVVPAVRFLLVDPSSDAIYIKNYGDSEADISAYRLCSEFSYTSNLTSDVTLLSGSVTLAPGDTLAVSWPITDVAADLGLYAAEGSFSDTSAMIDFLQWGAAGIGRESVASSKGIWGAGDFIEGNAPFSYTGDGSQNGLSTWSTAIILQEGVYNAFLSGSQEVNPIISTASGSVSAELSGDTLVVTGTFSGLGSPLDVNINGGVHIHQGYAGQNGAVVFPLVASLDADSLGGSFEAAQNTFVLSPEQQASLEGREFYINIHTLAIPSGELRGQLLPDAGAYYSSNLFGSNEVPSVMTQGRGALAVERNGNELIITGSFQNLESNFLEGVAHLHNGLAGQNGGVEIGLNVTPSEDLRGGILSASDNTFTLTEDQVALLEGRSLYANIHTEGAPGGELRGQLHPPATAVFRSHLSGANEQEPVLTTASGSVLIEFIEGQILLSGSFQGLNSEFNAAIGGGAHIHQGLAGQNGDVVFALSTDTSDDLLSGSYLVENNTFDVDADQLAALLSRGLYVNIHTVDNPPGELRGQIVPESMIFFTGFLTGAQETQMVTSQGIGAIIGEFLGGKLTVSGSFMGLESDLNTALAGGAHIHKAPAGSNGPIALILNIDIAEDMRGGSFLSASNTFELGEGLTDSLKSRDLYVNIHSLENGAGELRAQLVPEATAYFLAPLSGTNETTPVNTEATGLMIAELRGNRMTTSGSFSNLGGDFDVSIAGGAHIHGGYAGTNGGILFLLTSEIAEDSKSGSFQAGGNTFELSEGLIDSLLGRIMYVNIHTTSFQSGEIRGNFLPYAQAYFTTNLSGTNEVQPITSPGIGGLKGELLGNSLTITGGFSGLEGNFDVNIAGGAHLHKAPVGENGGIELLLSTDLEEDLKAGTFSADSNRFEVSEAQILMLREDSLYANLHSDVFGSGELRGQLLGDQNFFPLAVSTITSPEDGASILLEGDPEMTFEANWEVNVDVVVDRDPVAYIWELAADGEFSTVLLQVNVGMDTTVGLTFGAVDALLAENGIEVEDSITLFHRVLTSDGAVQSGDAGASVTLTRGIVTDIDPAILEQIQVRVFPSPTSDQTTLRLELPIQGQIEVSLLDGMGRKVMVDTYQGLPGVHDRNLDLSTLAQGLYFVQILLDNELITVSHVIKR